MNEREEALALELTRELERILEGLDPLSRMLMVAQALRAVDGGEWKVRASGDGGYVIERVAPRDRT